MMHAHRAHVIVNFDTFEEVAVKLTETTWCPCNGFKVQKLILLNDATSPDGAQEYAVFHESDPELQIESLTVSWFESAERLAATLQRLNDDPTTGVAMGHYRILTHARLETCRHCA
jgi:hypothetical protein